MTIVYQLNSLGRVPDARATYEQHQRIRPGLTLTPLHDAARFVLNGGAMTAERAALIREFTRHA